MNYNLNTIFIMDKIEVQKEIEKILNSHESKLHQLVSDGYRIVIKLGKDKPANVEVTKQIDTGGRNSGIRIQHDGISDVFSSKEALLFVVKTIGCKRFHENQGRAVIVSRDKPTNLPENKIEKVVDEDGEWFVTTNAGINQRVALLNNVFTRLEMDWTAERV